MAKKKYSINWENDEPVSFEVDGVTYNSLDDVPSERDRNKLAAMMDAASDEDAFEDIVCNRLVAKGYDDKKGLEVYDSRRKECFYLSVEK